MSQEPILSVKPKLIDDMAEMVLANASRNPVFKKEKPLKSGIKKLLKGTSMLAAKKGVIDSFYKSDQLQAYFMLTRVEFAPGIPVTYGIVNGRNNKAAKTWISEKIKEVEFLIDDKTTLEVPVHFKTDLDMFEDHGFFIDTVRLVGRPEQCLKRLEESIPKTPTFLEHDLKVSEATFDDLKELKALEYQEFKRNPQFGWFVANDTWINYAYKRRANAKKNKVGKALVLKDHQGQLKGYYGYDVDQTPQYGPMAGSELIFDQSLQGKGLSKFCYQELLKDIVDKKAKLLMGNTAQIGVLKHAKTMGRCPLSFSMRHSPGHFPKEHFLKFL